MSGIGGINQLVEYKISLVTIALWYQWNGLVLLLVTMYIPSFNRCCNLGAILEAL